MPAESVAPGRPPLVFHSGTPIADFLEWMAGMGDDNVTEFSSALEGEAALRPFILKDAEELVSVRPEGVAASLGNLVSAVDTAAIAGEFILAKDTSHSASQCWSRSSTVFPSSQRDSVRWRTIDSSDVTSAPITRSDNALT